MVGSYIALSLPAIGSTPSPLSSTESQSLSASLSSTSLMADGTPSIEPEPATTSTPSENDSEVLPTEGVDDGAVVDDPDELLDDPDELPESPSGDRPYEDLTQLLDFNQPAEEEDPIPENADDDAYLLGRGDEITLEFFNAPELAANENVYTLLVDGTLNLPWVGTLRLDGLTLAQAQELINQEYAQFLADPVITVRLTTPRPTRIAVVGEVNRPGTYTAQQELNLIGPEGLTAGRLAVGELRTVVEAIQTAGGITPKADIRNVQVRRSLPNGEQFVRPVNLWALLQGDGIEQDISLRDGDTIVVPEASEINFAETATLALANFSPDLIQVNIVGEVDNPGVVTVRPDSTLNEAILAAGGFDRSRARTGSVRLIRMNPDGTVSNRRVSVDLSAGLNEENNPLVRRDDIIVVSRSKLTSVADFLGEIGRAVGGVLDPFVGVFGIIDTINEIDDDADEDRIRELQLERLETEAETLNNTQ